jgi:hypothetical protein
MQTPSWLADNGDLDHCCGFAARNNWYGDRQHRPERSHAHPGPRVKVMHRWFAQAQPNRNRVGRLGQLRRRVLRPLVGRRMALTVLLTGRLHQILRTGPCFWMLPSVSTT